jgi:hypothetical protein
MTTFYIIDANCPWKDIKQVEGDIVQGKLAWVIIPLRNGGHTKRLLGATAFQSEVQAERAALGCIVKMSKYMGYFSKYHPLIANKLQEILKAYRMKQCPR